MPGNLRSVIHEKDPTSEPEDCNPSVPGQVAREAVEIVERIHGSFLQSVETAIAELLQVPVTLSYKQALQEPFSGALKEAGSAVRATAFSLSPVRGCAFLIFPLPLLFRVLDILLATPDTTFDAPRNAVTGIELHILQEFFNLFAGPLRESWQPFYPVAFSPIAPSPDEPELLAAECGGDLGLILRTTIDLNGLTADIDLVIPAFLAKLVELKAGGDRDAAPKPVCGSILNSIDEAKLRLEAVLRGSTVRIRDLLELSPGQILLVGNSKRPSFDCLVNGKQLFSGDLLASNDHCGIQIEKLVDAVATSS